MFVFATSTALHAAPPAVRKFAPELADNEYCIIVMAPKVAAELNLTAEQKQDVATLQKKLEGDIARAVNDPFVGKPPTFRMAQVRVRQAMTLNGRDLFRILSPTQSQRIADLHQAGKLQPITIQRAMKTSRGLVLGELEIVYTRYGEDEEKVPVDPLPPTTQPKRDEPPTKPPIPDRPPLHRT